MKTIYRHRDSLTDKLTPKNWKSYIMLYETVEEAGDDTKIQNLCSLMLPF